VRLLAASALLAAAAVAAGAFGAHGLAGRLGERELALWETSARYAMYAALAGLALATASRTLLDGRGAAAIATLLVGGLVFSVTVGALALGAPRWLGAVTPLGGIAMIAGLTLFALAALRSAGR